jgi:hypothetical protein
MPIYENLEPHPLANEIKDMSDEEYSELKEDINVKQTERKRIVIFDGMGNPCFKTPRKTQV